MILNSPTISGSLTVTGNILASGSITLSGSIASASFATTSSFVALAQSASNAVAAATASSADNLLVRNTLTAQTLVVQTITSSVDFVTGSTRFGSILDNTHVFSGSVTMNPGGLFVSGSGQVGIGSTTPKESLEIAGLYGNIRIYGRAGVSNNAITSNMYYNGTNWVRDNDSYGAAQMVLNAQLGSIIFGTTGSAVGDATERMRITSDGNVGIGTTTPDGKLHVFGKTYARYGQDDMFAFYYDDNYRFGITNPSTDLRQLRVFTQATDGVGFIVFATGTNTERGRFTSGGYFKASNNGNYAAPAGTAHELRNTNENWVLELINAHGSVPYGLHMYYSNSAPNTSNGSQWLWCEDTVNIKAAIYSNGTFASRTSTYGGFSDIKLKENIKPASPKLDDLLKVNVVNYNFIDDSNKEKQIGVIAQELESIFPNMIFETDDYENIEIEEEDENGNITKKLEKKELGTKTKSVKYSIFIPMLIKAIQELKSQNDDLQQQINELKAQ